MANDLSFRTELSTKSVSHLLVKGVRHFARQRTGTQDPGLSEFSRRVTEPFTEIFLVENINVF